jgi:hypothetical protein
MNSLALSGGMRINSRASEAIPLLMGRRSHAQKWWRTFAIMEGLLPIMWSLGLGAEVMQRIAVPTIGWMKSSTIFTLIVIPAETTWDLTAHQFPQGLNVVARRNSSVPIEW